MPNSSPAASATSVPPVRSISAAAPPVDRPTRRGHRALLFVAVVVLLATAAPGCRSTGGTGAAVGAVIGAGLGYVIAEHHAHDRARQARHARPDHRHAYDEPAFHPRRRKPRPRRDCDRW